MGRGVRRCADNAEPAAQGGVDHSGGANRGGASNTAVICGAEQGSARAAGLDRAYIVPICPSRHPDSRAQREPERLTSCSNPGARQVGRGNVVARVTVEDVLLGHTTPSYAGVTLDWWPRSKCDYGVCVCSPYPGVR